MNRNQNFEVLRVVALLMVILLHAINFNDAVSSPTDTISTVNFQIASLLEALCFVCVNLFVLIAGYLMATDRFSLTRVGRLWFTVWLYSVAVGLIATRFTHQPFDGAWLFPFTTGLYWYATAYLLLCMVSPFLNRLAQSLGRRGLLKLLLFSVGMFVIYPSLTGSYSAPDINLQRGYSLGWMVVLYLCGAFIRLYRKPADHARPYFLLYILFAALTQAVNVWVLPWVFGTGMAGASAWSVYRYNDVTVFAASLCLFLGFYSLKLNPKAKLWRMIVALAPYTFAAFVIHVHPAFRQLLWEKVIPVWRLFDSVWFIPLLLMAVPLLFVALCSVDIVRNRLFTLLHLHQGLDRLCDTLEAKLRGMENTRLFKRLAGETTAIGDTATYSIPITNGETGTVIDQASLRAHDETGNTAQAARSSAANLQ